MFRALESGWYFVFGDEGWGVDGREGRESHGRRCADHGNFGWKRWRLPARSGALAILFEANILGEMGGMNFARTRLRSVAMSGWGFIWTQQSTWYGIWIVVKGGNGGPNFFFSFHLTRGRVDVTFRLPLPYLSLMFRFLQ